MREIKFRAWNKENKKMLYEIPLATVNFYSSLEEFFKHTELMQYTGLKDKNGKEIYESDLLKCEDGKIREVIWYKLGAGWRVGTDDKDTYFNGIGIYADKLEIVGNKFENPIIS